jgi:hypothetical protein
VPLLEYSSKLLARTARIAVAASLVALPVHGAQEQRPNADGAAVKGFMERAQAYIDLQKNAEDGLPRLSDNAQPSQIEAHQAAMAARIKLARPQAKPGDIFGNAAPLIKTVIARDADMRPPREERAVKEEVPTFDPPKVNVAYPEKLARATMPPLLLDALPRLPEGLEYRLMGNDLILRDTRANLIADFIPNAIKPLVDGK